MADLSVVFTGLRFENPFLLASAPPTESEGNIMRAFDAGWGGVVTKTIGMHPVVNVDGPTTKFLRADADSSRLSMRKRPGSVLHSSWNWELLSEKPLDWWLPRIERIKKAHPTKVLVASIMAGSEDDGEVCTAAMLDQAVGPNVIAGLVRDMAEFLDRNAERGWSRLEDFRGIRRDRVVAHSEIKRPDESGYVAKANP